MDSFMPWPRGKPRPPWDVETVVQVAILLALAGLVGWLAWDRWR
jgi:hypothetical protein